MKNEQNAPKIRFKGFTDAWELRKLGEVCQINGRIGFRGYTEKDIISKATPHKVHKLEIKHD